MKGYKKFIIATTALFILYLVAELNKPKQFDWSITLSRADKNPFGAYIVFNQLKHLFPYSVIQSNRRSVYRQVKNREITRAALVIISPVITPPSTTTSALKNFVYRGNYVFASANWFYTPFLDSLGAETATSLPLSADDSASTGFVNPGFKKKQEYRYTLEALKQFFSKIDTTKTVLLGLNDNGKPLFIKIPYGKGAFFIHAAPLCFSNYFLLSGHNSSYAATALSYLPPDLTTVLWDESEKQLAEEPQTPLRFFLSNEHLRWALRLSLIGIIMYVLFEMKRRQRVIPVVVPLENNTVDFVKTVAGVHFSRKNNKEIASQKIIYFFEFLRNHLNISTVEPEDEIVKQVQRRSGLDEAQVRDLMQSVNVVGQSEKVSDEMLLALEGHIHNFYKKV